MSVDTDLEGFESVNPTQNSDPLPPIHETARVETPPVAPRVEIRGRKPLRRCKAGHILLDPATLKGVRLTDPIPSIDGREVCVRCDRGEPPPDVKRAQSRGPRTPPPETEEQKAARLAREKAEAEAKAKADADAKRAVETELKKSISRTGETLLGPAMMVASMVGTNLYARKGFSLDESVFPCTYLDKDGVIQMRPMSGTMCVAMAMSQAVAWKAPDILNHPIAPAALTMLAVAVGVVKSVADGKRSVNMCPTEDQVKAAQAEMIRARKAQENESIKVVPIRPPGE